MRNRIEKSIRATAETIGSVINDNGTKVQIAQVPACQHPFHRSAGRMECA